MGRSNSRVGTGTVRSRDRKASLASRLAAWAGLTEQVNAEPLEARQLLFTLSVTADVVDPNTGIGQVSAWWQYSIPYLITDAEAQTQEDTVRTEPFDDEPPGAVGSGAFFDASAIRTLHGIAPAGDYSIQPGGTDVNNRWLRAAPNSLAEFFGFEFWNDPDNPAFKIQATNFSFTVSPDVQPGDITGLLPSNIRATLFQDNIAVASFTGAALQALITDPDIAVPGDFNPALGVGVFTFTAPANVGAFDTIRFEVISPIGGIPAFRIDDMAYTVPARNNAALIDSISDYGARITLTGPVGAAVVVADLNGGDMLERGATGLITDLNDDGIPDHNVGIGSIRVLNSDSRTSISVWGGKWTQTTTRPNDADFFDGANAFVLADFKGLYDDMEDDGFGFVLRDEADQIIVSGLPDGPGSVVIGSPFLRAPNSNPYAPAVPAGLVTTGFTRADQGIFVDSGSIGSVAIHGMVFGSSRFAGSVGRLNIGLLLGSVSVEGDLGSLMVGSDMGQWSPDADFDPDPDIRVDPNNKTGTQIVVGRSAGEIAAAGRGLADITVIGDLNSPITRPARDVYNYSEKEYVFGVPIDTAEVTIIRQFMTNGLWVERSNQSLFRGFDQAVIFGSTWLRNDTIMGAEWIGSVTSGVRIQGELSGRDPFNGEDTDDVFAFAVDGTQEIVIEGVNDLTVLPPYYRIVDQDGRTLAAPELPPTSGRFAVSQLRWQPTGPGVYYLVVTDPNSNDTGVGLTSYTLNVTGMASTTLGAYRTAGGSGFTDFVSGEGNSVTILSGNIGSVRVGTGYVGGDGQEQAPTDTYNTVQSDDDSMSFQGGTFTTPGTLFNITTGSDIGFGVSPGSVVFRIGGNLGTLVTGLSQVVGGGPGEGDVSFLDISVGGRIGTVDIRGGIGMDQDETGDPRARTGINSVFVTTGTAGGPGDIGMFRTGFHVGGDCLDIRTSPGSVIGAFLTSQDVYDISAETDPRFGIYNGLRGVPIRTGAGSDVRFVDMVRIDLQNSVDVLLPILGDQPVVITDDGGAQVSISIEGAAPGVQVGTVRVLPIDGSQGVAIGQIEADLTGARILRINSIAAPGGGGGGGGGGPPPTGPTGIVGIGRIMITGNVAGAAVEITGSVEVDIYRLEQGFDTGGGGGPPTPGLVAFDHVTNRTPGGDIVAMDVASLDRLDVAGNIGSTQWPTWGPLMYSPFLGLQADLSEAVRSAIGVGAANGVAYDGDWNGNIFRPVNDDSIAGGNAYLDDIGGPMDGWLNGVVVRTGNVSEVRADGSIGDVILQGGGAILNLVNTNADRITPIGQFHGIVGTVFASDLGRIEIGDGLAHPTGPLSSTGIIALDDIQEVVSQQASGVSIRGPIMANNNIPVDLPGINADGILSVVLNNGVVQDAFIGAQNIDGFWTSFNYGEENITTGDVRNVQLTGTNMFRSTVRGGNLGDFVITNGFFDGSEILFTLDAGTISATGFRNSTLTGEQNEVRRNIILIGRNLQSLTAVNDMTDLVVDVVGSVRGSISAVNAVRSSFDVDNELLSLVLTNDLRGSDINVGALPSIAVTGNVQSSAISVSGHLDTMTVGGGIRSSIIEITGADGALGVITALTGISGSISAAGPIGTIAVTAGDLTANIITTTSRGNVTSLSASRDVAIQADISGSLGTITAGRNIGRQADRGVVLVRGDLQTASAPSGQLYADIRVGGAILGTVTVGGASNKPDVNLVGGGSIIAFKSIGGVVINGDFDGDILSYTGGIASVAINNGSLLPGNTIAAYDGNLTSVVITNGNLYGNIHADYNLTLLRVVAGSDGVFGDIGVNPAFSSLVSYDARRNQLPVGVGPNTGYQGARVSAGFNIVSVDVSNGSVFESAFVAGRVINGITINGSVANDSFSTGTGTFFAASDTIDNIAITGSVANAAFLAGTVQLGSDGRPGGAGIKADTVKSGTITRVAVNGNVRNSVFSAGMAAGADGLYNTGDDVPAIGLSRIETLQIGSVGVSVSAYADAFSSSVSGDNRYFKAGPTFTNPLLDNGQGTPGTQFTGSGTFAYSGANVTINLSGPGQAFFDAGTGRLTLRGTTSASNLTVSSSTGTIANFDIVTNDDSSLGTVNVSAALTGNSDFIVDGTVTTATFAAVNSTGQFIIGGDVGSWTFASLTGGHVSGRVVQSFRVDGAFGAANALTAGEADVKFLSAGTIVITGAAKAPLSVDRDASSIAVSGAVERGAFRVGGNLGTFSAASLSRSYVNAGNNLTTATVTGDAFGTSFMVGLDLGQDAAFGGSVLNADVLSTGFIGTITIGGNFRESSIAAGYNRGGDGFFGTTDDTVAPGRSTITSVVIVGSQTGSTRSSESYRIASSGTIGAVTLGGVFFNGTTGNFAVQAVPLAPAPVQVTEIRPVVDAGVWSANLFFNQPIDASSVSAALFVYEVRGDGEVLQRLAPGLDYSVSYNASANASVVTFARSVTERNLPMVGGLPGPGTYRFVFDQSKFRAKLANQPIDGNGDGFAEAGENFSGEAIVGDPGDKVTAGTAFNNGNAAQRVDFYGPAALDLVMDSDFESDGLPDVNKTFTVRGSIGDHPDVSNNYFSFASDVDLYAITLQAGQIIRLSGLSGPAELAGLSLLTETGTPLAFLADTSIVTSLPVPAGTTRDLTFPVAYLIGQTGTYLIAVGNDATVGSTATIPNLTIPPSGVGDYSFTVQVFDDGDSGFTSTTDSGDGAPVVSAPAPISFAGADAIFGNADDRSEIVIGSFVFTLNTGADNTPNTLDDIVSGTDGNGIVSTRDGAGGLVYTIDSSIGLPGAAGVPSEVQSDVDIYHLNNRQPIAPGTKMKVTIKTNELGGDLGTAQPPSGDRASQRLFVDNRGAVQFGLFDTSSSTQLDDGTMVFSPSDFGPTGGTPNRVVADNGETKYGFDANGDFYIEFVAPDRADIPGASASFAIYLQGVYNTDYRIEAVIGGVGQTTPTRQNVFIESEGGSVNWLEVGGLTTTISRFLPATLAFAGSANNGQPVREYILTQLTASLNSLFQGATSGSGLDVRFSTNPSDFEGEQFSTVYLSSKVDPIAPLFDPFNAFNFSFLSNALVTTQPFGFSQHSDPMNANVEDEAVVFAPAFALLGLTPSQVDLDAFIQSLTGAVSRRVGELVGLRISDENGQGAAFFDPMASDSVQTSPGAGRSYSLPNFDRALSGSLDSVTRTDFFLGRQNVRSLLDNVINPF
ncbi:hypothetical protein PHYC_02216 [Phycisphaerales bacterium]|nr:hypothetical protein PHYC_02216 [Phycisphaerales bacterium]